MRERFKVELNKSIVTAVRGLREALGQIGVRRSRRVYEFDEQELNRRNEHATTLEKARAEFKKLQSQGK